MYMVPANGSGHTTTHTHTHSISFSLSAPPPDPLSPLPLLPPPSLPHTLHFSLSSAMEPEGRSLRGLWCLVSHTLTSSILEPPPGSPEPRLCLSDCVACVSPPVLCAAGEPSVKEVFVGGWSHPAGPSPLRLRKGLRYVCPLPTDQQAPEEQGPLSDPLGRSMRPRAQHPLGQRVRRGYRQPPAAADLGAGGHTGLSTR